MNRIDWIDVAKGYGILGVIIGHITTPVITVWIYTFHIPLFFFLSGYLFHPKESFLEFVKRKSKSLLIPYLFLSIPVILNEYWFNYGDCGSWKYFVDELLKGVVQERYTPLWFIASLFCANLIFYCILRYINRMWIRVLCVMLAMISIYIYWKSGGAPLIWNLDVTLFIMPFLLLANIINNASKLKTFVNCKLLFFLVIFLVGNTLLGSINYFFVGMKVDLYFGNVDNLLFSFFAALCGIFFIILFSRIANWKVISYLGRNSLLIFSWHLIVYNWLGYFYDCFGLFQMPLSIGMILVRDSVSLILILSILIPINEALLRSKFKFVIGR